MSTRVRLKQVVIKSGEEIRVLPKGGVNCGSWYISVRCKGCGQPIYLVPDPADGTPPAPMVGEGHLSIPCPRCGNDSLYKTGQILSIRSEESIKDKSPSRPAPSHMPKQHIDVRYPNIRPTFGVGMLEDRPAAAALIARCLALWTNVEIQQARLLAEMLGANTEPSIALFISLQNGNVQFSVLDAVAKVALKTVPHDEYAVFRALMRHVKAISEQRNELAHGFFGGAREIVDGVAWIEPAHITQHMVVTPITGGVTPEKTSALREHIFVYELGDLETIAEAIQDLVLLIDEFKIYVSSYRQDSINTADWRADRFKQISEKKPIADGVASYRRGKSRRHTVG